MIFYYVRHGHPTYDPDALTPLGWREAEAVGKRLASFGVDQIFASSSIRAQETAKPTCEMVQKEFTVEPFAAEGLAWADFSVPLDEKRKTWAFAHPELRKLFTDPEVLAMGQDWYQHPAFAQYSFQQGVERVRQESDRFFAALGYEHIPGRGVYKAVAPNDRRVALFAHQGFGIVFLSCLLDIPFPQFSVHFDIPHTGLTVIEFPEEKGISIPRICSFSSDAHLYREGLPTQYNGRFYY